MNKRELTFNDLEPLLCDAKRAVDVLAMVVELIDEEVRMDGRLRPMLEDKTDALGMVARLVKERIEEAKDCWYSANHALRGEGRQAG